MSVTTILRSGRGVFAPISSDITTWKSLLLNKGGWSFTSPTTIVMFEVVDSPTGKPSTNSIAYHDSKGRINISR